MGDKILVEPKITVTDDRLFLDNLVGWIVLILILIMFFFSFMGGNDYGDNLIYYR